MQEMLSKEKHQGKQQQGRAGHGGRLDLRFLFVMQFGTLVSQSWKGTQTVKLQAVSLLPPPLPYSREDKNYNGHNWLKMKRVCVRQQGPCTRLRLQ